MSLLLAPSDWVPPWVPVGRYSFIRKLDMQGASNVHNDGVARANLI
jgi:hypothetical protein